MSSIYSGIKKVNPVGPTQKSNTTHTPPKQHSHIPPDKKPEKKKDKDSLVDIYAEQTDFSQMLKNITSQNPKGSAAEKILLGKFLGSDQGTYARNVLGKNHKGWVDHITWWLKMYQPKLQKEFTEVDFTDLESLAYDMYENYLAKQGQLEEGDAPPKAGFNPKPMKKGPGDSPDDYEYTAFVPRGKEASEKWAIKQTIAKQKLPKQKQKELSTGFYKNYLGNRPIREEGQALDTVTSSIVNYVRKNKMYLLKKHGVRSVIAGIQDIAQLHSDTPEKSLSDVNIWAKELENMLDRGKYSQLGEGEVVSLEARRSPLVVAGSPYDWDIYDLRTNKMVANILGGDRHESPLYEIRINRNGMTPTTRMLPTYVLRAGRNNNPPYKAYELVDTADRYGEIEKSPGPGGTTKLRPDQDDMLRHMFKVMGGGKYYGYDLNLVEEGLDQYEIIEKALGAKIMEVDDAMELGFTDWDPEDSSSIVYLGNKVNKNINEFFDAGGGGDDDDPDEEEILHKLASMWWNGSEQQQVKIQNTLEAMGWSIGEDEGSDAGGVFVVQIDDEHGSSYISWSPKDLQLDEGYSAGASGGAGIDEGKLSKTLGALALGTLGAVNAHAHTDTTKSVDQLAKERPALAQRLKDIGATGQVPASDIRARELQKKQDQELPASERRARELEKLQQPNMEEGQIYSTGGGPGEGWRWYKPKPAGLKEGNFMSKQHRKYESAIMKGLQREEAGLDKQMRREKKSKDIDAQIKKVYPYLVRNAKTGLEKEFINLDDAIEFARKEALPSLDSATVVYDRKSKFPVVAYRGSEEVHNQKDKLHEGDVVKGPWQASQQRLPIDRPDPSAPKAPVTNIPSAPKFGIVSMYKEFANSPQYMKVAKKGMDEDTFLTMAADYIESKLGSVKPALLGRYAEQFLQIHKSMQRASNMYEYGEVDTKRIIKFSKENPPNLDYLYQQFIQKMLSPDNKVDPYEWIDKVNDYYGLGFSWKDYQKRGHNDHTNNWQKIINKYILKR